MMDSRPFLCLDGATRELVLALALDERDWRDLGLEARGRCRCGRSDALWRMQRLHELCLDERTGLAERLGDRLDLSFADEVARVRFLAPDELAPAIRARIAAPDARGGAALLWALATDGSPCVRALGRWLACELRLAALRRFSASFPPPPVKIPDPDCP